jgi:hypothetical protein
MPQLEPMAGRAALRQHQQKQRLRRTSSFLSLASSDGQVSTRKQDESLSSSPHGESAQRKGQGLATATGKLYPLFFRWSRIDHLPWRVYRLSDEHRLVNAISCVKRPSISCRYRAGYFRSPGHQHAQASQHLYCIITYVLQEDPGIISQGKAFALD